MSNQEVYIVYAKRTAVGKAKRAFATVRPDTLLVNLLQDMMAQFPKVDWENIADVIIGCAMPEAEQGMNMARNALLLAGLPESVPGMTINRFCSSGIQSIALAADQIALGRADLIIAGGSESMSVVPLGGHKLSVNPLIFTGHGEHRAIAYNMGITAEKVAKRWEISREQQDEFALTSHQRALAAQESNAFADEIVPITVAHKMPSPEGISVREVVVDKDEGPRAQSTLEALAKLRPVFDMQGTVTAGNASQVSDGAGVLLLASKEAIAKYQLTPIARYVDFAVKGVAPEVMGIGPVVAIPEVLKHAGISQESVDWIELNEAFASQSLAVINELQLDPAKVNPCGGAIALGHPLGATGAIRAATCLHGLARKGGRYGMVTMCIGTGMGAAALFERL